MRGGRGSPVDPMLLEAVEQQEDVDLERTEDSVVCHVHVKWEWE